MLGEVLTLTRPLFLFDLETTSADPETARICQLAYQLHKPDGSMIEWHSLIDPRVEIPKDSADVHGVTDEIIREGCAKCRVPRDIHTADHDWKPVPTFADIAQRLYAGLQGCDLAGYNVVGFDIQVLDRHFRQCGLTLDMANVCIIDANRLWQLLEPRSLTHAVAHFGEEHERELLGAHDAMNDVRGTFIVLKGQLTRHRNSALLPRTVPELFKQQWPDRIDYEGKFVFNKYGEPCFGFGKNKGQPMRLHLDYLRWMDRQGNWSPAVTRIIKEALSGRFPKREAIA